MAGSAHKPLSSVHTRWPFSPTAATPSRPAKTESSTSGISLLAGSSPSWSGHGGAVSDIAISADGRRAATGSHDHSVILWDATKGTQKNRFLMPDKDRARSVAFLPDGSVLAAGGTIGQLVQWDQTSGTIRRQAEPPFVPHSDLAVLPDGRSFLTADRDGMVRFWTPRNP